MIIAGAINMSMLIIAATVFHTQGVVVEDLDVAYNGLKVALGPMVRHFLWSWFTYCRAC